MAMWAANIVDLSIDVCMAHFSTPVRAVEVAVTGLNASFKGFMHVCRRLLALLERSFSLTCMCPMNA